MKLFLRILPLLFLFCKPYSIAAQELPVKFLDITNGLSNNSVITIYQDDNDFMWFGTYDGLNRYDGYSFKTYRNRIGDTTSLSSNAVYCIQKDLKNNIWVGSSKGGSVLNQSKDSFIPLRYKSATSSKNIILSDVVHQIKSIKQGAMLAGSQRRGLLLFKEGSYCGIQIPLQLKGKSSVNYDVLAIEQAASGSACWVFVNNAGLCSYNIATNQLKLVYPMTQKGNCLASGAYGKLWIGTDDGVFLYDPSANSLSSNYMPGKISVANILNENEILWIATDGVGVYILPKDSRLAVPYTSITATKIIKSNSVWTFYKDTRGNKWIGTLRGGISMLSAIPASFMHVKYKGSDNLTDNFILSFCEDENNNLWIGTDGAGLRHWDRKKNTYTSYSKGSGGLTSNFITSIVKDDTNDIWLSTWAGGINRINPKTGKIDYFACYNTVTRQAEPNVWLLYIDSKKNIWASTTNEGTLYRFNTALNKFELFNADIANLQSLTETKDGKLWGGNYTSLLCIDPLTKKFKVFEIGNPVRCIVEDADKNLWIGTQEGGLLLFDRNTHKFKRFTMDDGLAGNTVLRLLQDKKRYLWMSTYDGLSRFDTKKKVFRNFSVTDGLQGNQFSFNAGLKLSSGEFLFGGINGFNIFYPEKIKTGSSTSKIRLASLLVNNKPVEHYNDYVIERVAGQVKSVRLPFDETTLSIEFVELDYNNSDKIDYAYTLDGWDEEWNYVNNTRKANYTRLYEGDYIFKVKTKSSNGTWNKEISLLHITVLPPWYRSWWSYTLYLVLFAGAIYAYLKYSRYKEQMRYSVKFAQMESKKEKELAEKQLSMFTYISHELRTPLSLIINPLRRAVRKPVGENNDLPNDLAVAYRNSRRLLSLVDQLLLFRKAESDADVLKISAINLNHLCNEVYECFVNQAKGQNIEFGLSIPDAPIEIFGDYEKIEIALFNITSNAFKHTPAGGSIMLQLIQTENEAAISITDTGSGIPVADVPFIFEKFRQVTTKPTSSGGFGIGLFIVKYFIEKHKGSVSCTSTLGQGSTFTLNFVKGKAHLPEVPISMQAPKMSELVEELLEDNSPIEIQPDRTEIESQIHTEIVTGKKSVLIIDDNNEIREYLIKLFSPQYLVYAAINGIEGLALTQKNIPDIVISDISMDGMDGLEVCRNIKQSQKLSHIPVILLTATTNSEVHLQGITEGADDYITKPFDSDILMARVETLLKSRENLRSYFLDNITLKENNQKVPAEYQEFLKKCIEIIEANLDDKDFTIKTFSKAMGMSHRSLYDKIKIISGETLTAFIRSVRLRRAALILLTEDVNIAHASAQVGFEDQRYFRQQFVKLFGMTPSDYIRKYKSSFNRDLNVIK
ncbi:histidine kinase [Flavobacterium rivuli WB 3.3-2 = DSM 21788]|uniref:histidine kinase n=1 Tax=Flavobacterium rivuli WB 3.3-2 = DSM 21788 TaxID=1121895 RepID=A0A0A2M071_9FLAO|nr:hybrid sensor histidine kinase/response regulator transcription factor [Flavobacterium rivuli]KGO84873.1 histidine kinase [Flavobacterium rivuli WB 3.3-2 = DSM 21788]